MSEREPRYSTLRDYLALLRRQRWVVLAVTLAFGGAALALSASAEKTYQAEASTQFNDIARDARLAGGIELPADATGPVAKTFLEADQITSLETAREVVRRLRTDVAPEQIQGAISTQVDSQSLLIDITAAWSDPDFAAAIANAVAEVTVDAENERLARQLDKTIKDLKPRTRGQIVSETGIVNLPVFNARNTLSAISTLRELVDQGVVAPAEVARRAQPPAIHSSPRIRRNTVLGLMVGLALGLIAGFVRDVLDRRIRTAKDAHDEFELPVLGRVGTTALGSTGVARGAHGFRFVSAADVEAFRILRTNMASLSPERPPRSVLVTSGLPQEGKSTVASALAAASAAAGQRTLLVDADLRRPALAERFGLRPSPGLSEYLAGSAEPQEILHTVGVSPSGARNGSGEGDRSLVCIPAGNPQGEPAELLASERFRGFIEKVGRAYDLVVIDTSPLLATADPLELAPHVESVLICVRLTSSTREEARAVNEAIRLLPERPAGIVVTGASASDGYYGYYGY